MDHQKAELKLIAENVSDLLQLLLNIRTHESAGYLTLGLSPLVGFVSEESYKYLSKQDLLAGDPLLFKSFGKAIIKLRALLKLFDDNDGGKDGLNQTLQLFQRKSAQWMDVNKSEWQRIFSKSLQPDLGIYFVGKNLFYPSIVGFSTTGLTRQQIEQLEDKDFAGLSQSTFDFSQAAGDYLTKTLAFIQQHVEFENNSRSASTKLLFAITHNDFFSKKIYAEVANRAQLLERDDAIVLLYLLGQVNVAQFLLPQLLPRQSNLLFRLRFLIAYHATTSLFQLQTKERSEFSTVLEALQALPALQNERAVRNVLAHYGFGKGRKYLITNNDPLNQVIEGLSGQDQSCVSDLVTLKLEMISNWAQANFSKDSLTKFRALLGDHT